MDIENHTPPGKEELETLAWWLKGDLKNTNLRQKGRPADYQRTVFAAETGDR